VLLSVLKGPSFTSTASLLAQSRRTTPTLPAMAAQFGLTLAGGEANQSPQFYVDLVKSREIIRPVVMSSYDYTEEGKHTAGTLPKIYGFKDPNSEAAVQKAIERLRKNVSAAASAKTGVVTVSLKTPSPTLSRVVLQRMLDELNRFNLESRQSQASAERKFTEARLANAESDLRAAEQRLQDFLQENREFRSSPKLSFEEDRLARDINTRQQVYNTLAQLYEQARMDEVRDTPLITIVEKPDVPFKPDSRHAVRNAIFGMFFALLAAVLALFVTERRRLYLERSRSQTV
jgi:uncharacterized protein involved in exopolysaccharide biosynthesis